MHNAMNAGKLGETSRNEGVAGETVNNEDVVKGLKLLLYKETEKNHKLRDVFKEQFGIEFNEEDFHENDKAVV